MDKWHISLQNRFWRKTGRKLKCPVDISADKNTVKKNQVWWHTYCLNKYNTEHSCNWSLSRDSETTKWKNKFSIKSFPKLLKSPYFSTGIQSVPKRKDYLLWPKRQRHR